MTIALLLAVVLVWLIEHDWPNPVVLMHVALFVAVAPVRDLVVVFIAAPVLIVACTTAQRPEVQRNVFLPPAAI
jgi:hypothetical protein